MDLSLGSESGVDLEGGIGGFEMRVRFLASWNCSIKSEILGLKSWTEVLSPESRRPTPVGSI